jgi:hypothetical protein
MSIDAQADERQEAVRGRVKEKPEIEIDPSLPHAPSKFPLALAISLAVLVTVGVVFAIYALSQQPGELTDAQRENTITAKRMQDAFVELWDTMPEAHRSKSCVMLVEIVRKPCLPTVDPTKLAIGDAALAITAPGDPADCSTAVGVYSKSRFDAKCD